MAEEPAKGQSDFLRLYVIVMLVMAGVLAYFLWTLNKERKDYEDANASARAVFGSSDVAPTGGDQRATIRSLAVGVQKYLATFKEATVKAADGGLGIPIETIKDRATGMGLETQGIVPDQSSKNQAKRYEEISSTFTFSPTDLQKLARFLYNVEASSTRFRILDVRWELRTDKENPYAPGSQFGNLITRPQVKIGFRRPITGGPRGS